MALAKVVKILKQGTDTENIKYWRSLSPSQRLSNLERIRNEIIKSKYGNPSGLQRTVKIIQRK